MMAKQAAEVKNNIILLSPRFPLRGPEGGCANSAGRLACAKFGQAQADGNPVGLPTRLPHQHRRGGKRAHHRRSSPAAPPPRPQPRLASGRLLLAAPGSLELDHHERGV